MKKKKSLLPRSLLKGLVDDIKKLVNGNEGRMFLLEMMEDIPFDMRPSVIEGLASYYQPEMVGFLHLLKIEYGRELENCCDRGLDKFRLAGLDTSNQLRFDGEFFGAYASCTRYCGRMTLDIAWDMGGEGLQVECFYLTFNPDGLHSFFVIEDMPRKQYEQDRKGMSDIVQVNLDEACFIIGQAFDFNVHHMTRPALGKFLYDKYLDRRPVFSSDEKFLLMKKISPRLTPRQLINSFFYALRSQDKSYLSSLFYAENAGEQLFSYQTSQIFAPGSRMLEGQVSEVSGSRQTSRVTAYSVSRDENEFFRNEYRFYLLLKDGCWLIGDIDLCAHQLIPANSDLNPLNRMVFCRVYEIIDLDHLFELLDQVENMREIQELPYGMHMRISTHPDDFSSGVALLTGVLADLVINGDEFVLITRDTETMSELHELLIEDHTCPVVFRSEYEVGLMTAYNYLGGQYASFEELLMQEDGNLFTDKALCFLTARYYTKDRARVLERLEKMHSLKVELDGDHTVYYQMDNQPLTPGLFVEYVLGPTWLSLSAFGERDINAARGAFETQMYDYLEYEGMEIKCEGIFDILDSTAQKEHPELEAMLKDIYLDKWYYAHLSSLSGLSPSEASQTEEGSRLLWGMFKRMKQKERHQYLGGQQSRVRLNEYIRKVAQKNALLPQKGY